jgi:hypothetical protein
VTWHTIAGIAARGFQPYTPPMETNTAVTHNPLNLTAVRTDTTQEIGTITMWDCSETELERLAEAWRDADLKGPGGRLSRPLPPSAAKALSEACVKVVDGRRMIVRRDPNGKGMRLIAERRQTEEGKDPEYLPELHVWLENGGLAFNNPSHVLAGSIREKYHALRETLTTASAGDWLSRLTKELEGVPLRRAGGMYFIPTGSNKTWGEIASLTWEATGGSITVYQIPAFADMGDTLPAVLTAVRDELSLQVARLTKEVEDSSLGDKARETKQAHVNRLLDTIGRYEGLCGTTLDDLRSGAKRLLESLSTSKMDEAALKGDDLVL